MLVDKFNRPLELIEISASVECQYDCSFCGSADKGGPGELFSSESITRFVRVMALLGIKKVRLIGKEPFLRPDIAALLSGLGAIKPALKVSLSTNGKLLRNFAGDVKKAGVEKVYVTIPAIEKGLYAAITGQDDLDEIMDAIDEARSVHGLNVVIRTPIMQDMNADAIDGISDWAIAAGMDLYLVECGEPFITQGQIVDRLAAKHTLDRMEGVSVSNNPWRVESSGSMVKVITMENRRMCGSCNRLWLSADGMLSLCAQTSEKHDLKSFFEDDPSDAELAEFASKIPFSKPQGFNSNAHCRQTGLSVISD